MNCLLYIFLALIMNFFSYLFYLLLDVIYCNFLAQKAAKNPIGILYLNAFNTQYMRNPDMVYVLKMEYVSIYFWPKNDGEKWSRKNIPPCAKPFSDLI